MTQELAQVDLSGALPQKYDDKVFEKVAAGKFIPRIQFMSSSSELCKDGSFPVNHYALFKSKTPIDLTTEVIVLCLAWRPKALRMGDSVLAFYNPDDPEFQKVEAESELKDSGCMYGPEFLVWIPSINEFATFFMGSKSARNEAPNLKALIGKAATLRSQKIQTKKYTWQAPQIAACTTPFDLPTMEAITKAVDTFNNPPKEEIETVEDTTERAR